MPKAADIAAQKWDAVVIGTGMGGATLGYALARAGMRVLFCEKGHSLANIDQVLSGDYAESFVLQSRPSSAARTEYLLRAGRNAEQVEDISGRRRKRFVPYLGCGTGGSTALYGMALERFWPQDFEPGHNHEAAREADLPGAWPVSYQDLAPFYTAAEQLFRIRGTPDPLRTDLADQCLLTPHPATKSAEAACEFLSSRGMHPYRLPSACEQVASCRSCQGYVCLNSCKNDAFRVLLQPAIVQHGALILADCEVTSLTVDGTQIVAAQCRVEGKIHQLRSRLFFLAAGALQTPAILLRSSTADGSPGLGNRSSMVGRYLMRHFVDLYLVRLPGMRADLGTPFKEVAFSDYYLGRTGKLGTVQSFGQLPPGPVVYDSLRTDLRDTAMGWAAAPLSVLAKPVIERLVGRWNAQRLGLATILEDLPYADNQVIPSTDDTAGLKFRYTVKGYDRTRIKAFRQIMRKLLRPCSPVVLREAENNQRLAHVSGTCRFGSDARSSVLDPYCRAHDLDNLYVVDGSFFPSSGGTNPSLTIAANALRVATHLTG